MTLKTDTRLLNRGGGYGDEWRRWGNSGQERSRDSGEEILILW